MRVTRVCTVAAALLSMLIGTAAPAEGQYFGRNKVEYVDFDFRVLSTEHFDIYFYPREERAARVAAELAERWYARFSRLLRHELHKRQPLVLYGSQAEFAQTNVVSGLLSDSVGGVTEGARRRIAMPFAPTMAETDRVLGHEIAHAFQFDIARRHGGGTAQPLWFIEGMAEYLARGASDTEAGRWLRDLVMSKRLPRREKDAARHLSPYHYGHAFWAYLAQRFGDEIIEKALKPGKRAGLDDRMQYATGSGLEALYADWRETVASAVRSAPAASRQPADKSAFGGMQLGPALSPDGRQAVFFSERDRLALDLFLADVRTGRIIRKLATTTASARFDSLQPLRSSGAWSPSGEEFAFAAVRQGQAALLVVNISGEGRDRELLIKGLGQILSPTWSPDGKAIAFSALAGGFTDLYVYDLGTDTLRQLTDDAFADLQPSWSPDGASLAFATERYSSDLSSLRFGRPQLATIDLGSGGVRAVTADPDTAHTNPQWSPDGDHLYFVADPDGVGNVFRLDLQTSITHRVTDVGTGVGGMTPASPALSLASQASVLAYTVYRNGVYQLAILDGAPAIDGEPLDERTRAARDHGGDAAPDTGLLAGLLADSRLGRPDPATIVNREYSSRLSLERIGQPYVSSGGGPFGTFVRAGGSLLFGDMLNERRFGAAIQIGNQMRDIAVEARYLNQERRWNWGAIAELEPTLRRYRRAEAIEHHGEPALVRQADYFQRVQLRAAGLLAYPFSRGLRIELTGGTRHATYHREVRSRVSSLETGRVLTEDRVAMSGGAPTTVAEISGALVGDTTVFGPTGPLLGSRYRFEIASAAGSLAYTRVLADYRRYVMPVRPYSLAVRLLHSGRYGPGGDDPRLLSSFLGSQYFVRGHGRDTRYCQPGADRICGDELLGSRLLVGNVEARFPLWGMLSRELEYGPLPADVFVFADGGLVWSRDRVISGRGRTFISSVGAGVRLNAGGLPVEVAAVRALDGPAPGWLFDLGFRVGF